MYCKVHVLYNFKTNCLTVPVQGVEIELKIILLKTVTSKKKHIDRK